MIVNSYFCTPNLYSRSFIYFINFCFSFCVKQPIKTSNLLFYVRLLDMVTNYPYVSTETWDFVFCSNDDRISPTGSLCLGYPIHLYVFFYLSTSVSIGPSLNNIPQTSTLIPPIFLSSRWKTFLLSVLSIVVPKLSDYPVLGYHI